MNSNSQFQLYSNEEREHKDTIVDDENLDENFTLLSLPSELLQRILTYQTYDETSQARLVWIIN